MTCDNFWDLVNGTSVDDQTAAMLASVTAHMIRCPDCFGRMEQIARESRAMGNRPDPRNIARSEEIAVDPEVREVLCNAIRECPEGLVRFVRAIEEDR